ncbi:MAG: ester cyclase [Dehalococcoidia bacterium]|nr:ester cyclase [Dehalococcoidia bacterium]
MSEQNKAVLRRFIEEVFNKGNTAAVDQLVAPDFVNHNPLPGATPDREGFKRGIAMLRAAFPGLHYIEEDMIAEGDKVVGKGVFRGTHLGELMGIGPMGKQVNLAGIAIFRVSGGKITARWATLDMLGLMQQLGVIPAQG